VPHVRFVAKFSEIDAGDRRKGAASAGAREEGGDERPEWRQWNQQRRRGGGLGGGSSSSGGGGGGWLGWGWLGWGRRAGEREKQMAGEETEREEAVVSVGGGAGKRRQAKILVEDMLPELACAMQCLIAKPEYGCRAQPGESSPYLSSLYLTLPLLALSLLTPPCRPASLSDASNCLG